MLFSDVYVNEDVKNRLRRTVQNQRVSHAQLFRKKGTHSLALAIAYAQYINCSMYGKDSCGICPSCKNINSWHIPICISIFLMQPIKNKKDPQSSEFYTEWREMILSTGHVYFK